ncbi:MAG: hypothetical protein IJU19_02910 [Bacteroidales bacterium]|nr:hypothetical protein [Bacteroidales bacterium]
MEQISYFRRSVGRTVAMDAALLALACVVPMVSHALAFPLYKLNPMLALLLASMLGRGGWRNGVVMAVLLPLASWLVVGMPVGMKAVCMAAELLTVAAVWGELNGRWKPLAAVMAAVVVGKGVYYGLKAVLISSVALVGTEWWVQVGVAVAWCGLFALVYKRMQ